MIRSLIITLVVLSAVCLIWHPIYYVNDDFIIRDILSGRYSGTPDAHVFNVIYPVAFILTRLYTAFPNTDFWGILIWILPYICLFVLLNSTMNALPDRPVIAVLAVLSVFCVTALFCSVFFTFTMSGALCAVTGVYRLMINKEPQKILTFIPSLLLFLAAFCIRKDTLFMVAPFCMMYFFIEFIKRRSFRFFLHMFMDAMLLLICMSALWVFHTRAFDNEEWSTYKEFRSLRKAVHDYSKYPDYDGHSDFYEELGLSREEYAVIGTTGRGGVNTAMDISPDIRTVLSSVGEYNSSLSEEKGLKEKLDNGANVFLKTLFTFDSYFPVHILILIPLIIITVLMSKNKATATIRILAGMLVFAAELFALSYKGRMTFAVLYSLIAVSGLYILAVLITDLKDAGAGIPKKMRTVTAAVLILIFALFFIHELWFISFRYSVLNEREMTGWKIDKYVTEHPDGIFFEPSMFLVDISYPLTDFSGEFSRVITLGGWNYSSPEYVQAAKTAGLDNISEIESAIVNNDNAYIISSMKYMKSIVEYLEWKYGPDLKYEKAGVVYGNGKVYCWRFYMDQA